MKIKKAHQFHIEIRFGFKKITKTSSTSFRRFCKTGLSVQIQLACLLDSLLSNL